MFAWVDFVTGEDESPISKYGTSAPSITLVPGVKMFSLFFQKECFCIIVESWEFPA